MTDENKEFVICKICGEKKHSLMFHLKYVHKMTTKEYLEKFPDSKILSDDVRNRIIQGKNKSSKDVKDNKTKSTEIEIEMEDISLPKLDIKLPQNIKIIKENLKGVPTYKYQEFNDKIQTKLFLKSFYKNIEINKRIIKINQFTGNIEYDIWLDFIDENAKVGFIFPYEVWSNYFETTLNKIYIKNASADGWTIFYFETHDCFNDFVKNINQQL